MFSRKKNTTLGAAVLCGAALFATAACDGGGTEKSENEAPERGNAFPRSPAAEDGADKTAVTPKEPAAPASRGPGEVIAEEPTVESEPALPESYDALMSAGKELLDSGDAGGALAHFEEALEKEPARAMPHIQVARAHVAAGDESSARDYAEKAVELAPGSSFAWNTLGRVELAENDPEAAITSFQRAADENEENSYAWNNLGLVYLMQERWEEAATALENATSGAHPTAYMWNNLGLTYEQLGLLDEARAAFRQGNDLGSDKAASHLERLKGVESLEAEEPVDMEEASAEPVEIEEPLE